jgi:hypothetical protein
MTYNNEIPNLYIYPNTDRVLKSKISVVNIVRILTRNACRIFVEKSLETEESEDREVNEDLWLENRR